MGKKLTEVEKLRRAVGLATTVVPEMVMDSEDPVVMMLKVVGKVTALEKMQAKLVDALSWCSGSADFGPGGQAHKGWQKGCAPLLKKLK